MRNELGKQGVRRPRVYGAAELKGGRDGGKEGGKISFGAVKTRARRGFGLIGLRGGWNRGASALSGCRIHGPSIPALPELREISELQTVSGASCMGLLGARCSENDRRYAVIS